MKAFINKIVSWWRAIIKYRAGMSPFFKGLWDGFWYFIGGYILAFIIFLFFPEKVGLPTAAWIAATIAGGIFIFVFLYVIIVEENIFNVKRKSKNKNTEDVIKLSDLTTNVVSGATEIIYESQESQFDKDNINMKKELKSNATENKSHDRNDNKKPHAQNDKTTTPVDSKSKQKTVHKVDPRSSVAQHVKNDPTKDPDVPPIDETLEV